jgi:integrase
MPSQKLTSRAITRSPPKTGTLELWDTVVPGLALRIGYGGKRAYCVTTRIGGTQVRRTLGSTATHTLAEARDAARDILHHAEKGIDIASKDVKRRAAQEARREAERAEAGNFRAVAEAWLADNQKGGGAKLTSKKAIESMFERDVYPTLGARPVHEITRAEIRDLVRAIAAKRPFLANRCLAYVRRALSWAVSQDKLETNPAVGIAPPGEEKSRDRVLDDDEIAKLWPAFNGLGYPFGAALKLLLLTGARRSEVSHMKWSEIKDDTWHLPGERTKNNLPCLVPLSTAARQILDDLPRMDGSEYLFTTGRTLARDPKTGERITDRPISNWGGAKAKLDKIAGVENWRLHDLRRTLVTGMNEKLKIEPHVIEAVVNHVSGAAKAGVAGVYNRAQYLEQRKAALESWANHIMGLVGDAPDSNVIDLRKAK